jgi:ribulose-phosphate 3-epimerase
VAVDAVRPHSQLPFHSHLMISRPLAYVTAFAEAGSDIVIFHLEADDDPEAVIGAIRAAGRQPGLAINPETPAEAAHPYLDRIDMLLVMTVNPGWGGQPFIEHSIAKLERLKRLLPPEVVIEVDGGIDAETAPRCAAAGASLFVAGSAVFGAPDPAAAYEEIERSVNG